MHETNVREHPPQLCLPSRRRVRSQRWLQRAARAGACGHRLGGRRPRRAGWRLSRPAGAPTPIHWHARWRCRSATPDPSRPDPAAPPRAAQRRPAPGRAAPRRPALRRPAQPCRLAAAAPLPLCRCRRAAAASLLPQPWAAAPRCPALPLAAPRCTALPLLHYPCFSSLRQKILPVALGVGL